MNLRKLLTNAAFYAACVMFMAGCSSEQPVLQSASVQVDKSELEVSVYNDDLAFSVSWDAVKGADAYFVQFTADSDPEFLKAYVVKIEDGSTNLEMTYNDMKLIHDATGVISDYKLLIRVLSEGRDCTSSYSRKAIIDVAMSMWPELGTVYLCGDAAPCSWTTAPKDNAIMKPKNGEMYDLYEWEGLLNAAPAGFRINTADNWFPSVMYSIKDGKDVYLTNDDYYGDSANYPHYTVDEKGIYKVTADFTDFTNIKVTITYVGEAAPEPTISGIWIVGDAAPRGWDFNDMEQFTKNGGTYSWSGHLMPSPAVFRFQVKDVGFFPSIVIEKETGKNVICDGDQWNTGGYDQFTVAEEGDYDIVVDPSDESDIKVTISKK